MAVDSRDKRFAMMGLGQPVPSMMPNPDGTIGSGDRAMFEFLYPGIALVGAAIKNRGHAYFKLFRDKRKVKEL